MSITTLRRAAATSLLASALALTPLVHPLRAQGTDTTTRSTTTTTSQTMNDDRGGDRDNDSGKWGLAGLLGLLGLLGLRRREPDRVVETRTTTDPNLRR